MNEITTLTEAELDHVAAGFRFTAVGVVAALQTNASSQVSLNALSLLSGNQRASQENSVNIG